MNSQKNNYAKTTSSQQSSIKDTESTTSFRRLCFCCPFFSKKSFAKNSDASIVSAKNEQYEYIVEKLAIKKVPLSLFATKEDLERARRNPSMELSQSTVQSSHYKPEPRYYSEPIQGTTVIESSQTPSTALPFLPLEDKKSVVTFSSYYAMVPKADLTSAPPTFDYSQSPSLSVGDEVEMEDKEIIPNLPIRKRGPVQVMAVDQEREMVSQILNKHSSLFCLDSKQPIPKDPLHLPRPAVVPTSFRSQPTSPSTKRSANYNRQPPPQQNDYRQSPYSYTKKVHVEIHQDDSQFRLPVEHPEAKREQSTKPQREMEADVQQAIDALATAQKPHTPGLQPKNQRSLRNNHSPARELFSDPLINHSQSQEVRPEEAGQSYLNFRQSRPVETRSEHEYQPIKNKTFRYDSDPQSEDEMFDYQNVPKAKSTPHQIALPYSQKKAVDVLTSTTNFDNEAFSSMVGVPGTSKTHKNVYSRAQSTELVATEDSGQVTEISQMKGQNLKWKIIIKHHTNDKLDRNVKKQVSEIETDRRKPEKSRNDNFLSR